MTSVERATPQTDERAAGRWGTRPLGGYVPFLTPAARALGTASHVVAVATAAAALIGLAGVVLLQIVSREFLGGAALWTTDVSEWLFIWAALVGGSVAVADGSAPAMLLLYQRTRGHVRIAFDGLRDGVSLFVFGYLLVYGYQLAGSISAQTSISGISLVYVAAAVPVAAGLMLAQKLAQLSGASLPRLAISGVVVTGALVAGRSHALAAEPRAAAYTALLALLLLALAVGTPVADSLLFAAIVAYGLHEQFASGIALANEAQSSLQSFVLVAVPLYLLVGVIIAHSRAGGYIAALCRDVLGWLPGGLAVANIGASAVLADISGSATADAVALTKTFTPQLVADGYPLGFAAGLQAASGTLGILVPPSISVLLFASVTTVSVGDAFAALILPAGVVVLSFALTSVVLSRRNGWGTSASFSPRRLTHSLPRAAPALGAVVIILGGIFSGKFTASESGAVAVAYLFALAAIGYRDRRASFLLPLLRDAVVNIGRVGFLLSAAFVFGWVVLQNNGPRLVVSALVGTHLPPRLLLLIVLVVMAAIANVIEPPAVILVAIPLVFPVISTMHIELLTFVVVVQLVMAIALCSPPMGICLFLVSATARTSYESAARAVLPYVLMLALDAVIVVAFPALATTLPRFVR